MGLGAEPQTLGVFFHIGKNNFLVFWNLFWQNDCVQNVRRTLITTVKSVSTSYENEINIYIFVPNL